MDVSYILTQEIQDQGFTLNEPDDHILELRRHGKLLASFSQTEVTLPNILKEIQKEIQEVSKN